MEHDQSIELPSPELVDAETQQWNPYVGPKPLQASHQLFARECELQDLSDLLIAERLVLLYSPSGAGKTSLINAGLVTHIRTVENFRVLPTIRVNLTQTGDALNHPNRYVRSVTECLKGGLSKDQRIKIEDTTMPSLSDYLRQRPRCEQDGPIDSEFEVLIFDQFEEIITLDPTDRAIKEQFFGELREVLRDRNRWALFVIREDYLAQIDAFSHLLPTSLATRFRLNLLTRNQAAEAIRGPALAAGSPFAEDHVQLLVEDLATVTIQDGAQQHKAIGEFVEPVQLQVVCRRLWQLQQERKLTRADLERSGAVDEALGDFYDQAIKASVEKSKVAERYVRDWIDTHLIVQPSMRNQIVRGGEITCGLPDRCVDALVGEHLLRYDMRNGREWIEITHDRMVLPILESNDRWRKDNLSAFQQQAALWNAQGRGDNMLLSESAIPEAQQWCLAHEGEIDPNEESYLAESIAAANQACVLKKHHHDIRVRERIVYALGLLVIIISAFTVRFFINGRNNAETQKLFFEGLQLNGDAQALSQGQYLLTLEKALKANDILRGDHKGSFAKENLHKLEQATRTSLIAGLAVVPPTTQNLIGHTASIRRLAFHPRLPVLASAGFDQTVIFWNTQSGTRLGGAIRFAAPVYTVAFNKNGSLMATGDASGSVQIYSVSFDSASHPTLATTRLLNSDAIKHNDKVTSLAFGPHDEVLATAGWDRQVLVWDISSPSKPTIRTKFAHDARQIGRISSLLFIGNDKIAFGDWLGNLWIWPWKGDDGKILGPGSTQVLNFSNDTASYVPDDSEKSSVYALSYHAASDRLAASGWKLVTVDGSTPEKRSHISVWNHVSDEPQLAQKESVFGRSETPVTAIDFSKNGRSLVFAGGENKTIGVKYVATSEGESTGEKGDSESQTIRFQERLFSVAYPPIDSGQKDLVAIGGGRTISLVDLNHVGPLPARDLNIAVKAPTRSKGWKHVAISDDARMVVMGSESHIVVQRAKDTPIRNYSEHAYFSAKTADLSALALNKSTTLIATGGTANFPITIFNSDGRELSKLSKDECEGQDQGSRNAGYRIAFSQLAKNSLLAVALGKKICLYDLSVPTKPKLTFKINTDGIIRLLSFDRAGTRVAVVTDEAKINLWSVGNQYELRDLHSISNAPTTKITAISFTPEGRQLIIGTSESDIWITNLNSQPHKFDRLDQLHEVDIAALAFGQTPRGTILASSDIEGRIMLWGQYTPNDSFRRLGRTLTQKSPMSPIAFSDNSDFLLVGGAVPRLWDLRMNTLVRLACEVAERDSRGQIDSCKDQRK